MHFYKFPYQETRWNIDILRGDAYCKLYFSVAYLRLCRIFMCTFFCESNQRLLTKTHSLFSQKHSITDIWQGSSKVSSSLEPNGSFSAFWKDSFVYLNSKFNKSNILSVFFFGVTVKLQEAVKTFDSIYRLYIQLRTDSRKEAIQRIWSRSF